MKNKKRVLTFAIAIAVLIVSISLTLLAQQDRYTLKIPDGLAFSDIKGYDTWQDVAVSETESSVKAIVANPTMMTAFISPSSGPDPQPSSCVVTRRIRQVHPGGRVSLLPA